MTWECIQENWHAYRGSAKHTWNKLSTAQLEDAYGSNSKENCTIFPRIPSFKVRGRLRFFD